MSIFTRDGDQGGDPAYLRPLGDCGSRLFTTHLDSFPGTVFVMLGSLDRPDLIAPKLEMFTKRRLPWMKSLDLPQFPSMPG